MPRPDDSVLAAYRQALGEGLAVPVSGRARWRLSGPDAQRYLNGQVTNSLMDLERGHARYAAVCTAKGRMEGDTWIAWDGDSLWIDAPGELNESLGARLDKYLIADNAELSDVSGQWTLIHHIGEAKPGSQRFVSHRFGPTGTDAWLPATQEPLDNPAATAAAELLRLEHGLARWGADMSEKTLPPEAGLDRNGISYTKGCYVGQETIARIKSIGHVNRELCVLAAEGDDAPEPGTELTAGEDAKPTGRVTSSGWSPVLAKGIALGYVHRQHATTGTVLRAGAATVEVVDPPCPASLTGERCS